MNLLIEENITGFCDRRWNALAAGLMPARHEYLAALDAHSAGVNHYCVLEEDDAYLCAARLTVSTGTDRRIAETLYGRALRAAAGLGLVREQLVVCGWTPGQGSNIILDRSLPATRQEEMIARVCDRIERIAGERAVVFPSVQLRDEVLARVLSGRGYCVASDRSVACLDVEWDGAAGYLAALKRRSRRSNSTARLEINRFRRSGAVVERMDPGADEWEKVCDLLNRHHERLNDTSLEHTPEKLRQLREALGEDLIVYVARQDGGMTGACVAIRCGTEASLIWVGVDHAAAGRNFTYFNLVFYAPVEHLAALGVRRIWLGSAAYEAKIRRGCRIIPSRVFMRLPTKLGKALHRPAFALQRAWSGWKYRRYLGSGTS